VGFVESGFRWPRRVLTDTALHQTDGDLCRRTVPLVQGRGQQTMHQKFDDVPRSSASERY